jgi:putative peptidoglycan lipid II flippase
MSNEPDFVRSSAVMAAGTLVSRLTGLLRSLLLVAALGTSIFADTFNVANTLPTVLYILLAGGALNSVFVPQLVRAMKDEPDGGEAFTSRLLTIVTLILTVITALSVIFSPLLVRIYAPKFTNQGIETEFSLTVTFMRYCLPQILMMGIFVMWSQVGNARGKFGPMMWAPVANNLVVIAVLIIFLVIAPDVTAETITPAQVALLGLGTSLGFVIQAALLFPVVAKSGLNLRPRFDWKDSNLTKSFKLGAWTLLFVFINQIGYLVVVNVATAASAAAKIAGITTGVGFTPYSYAYFVFILPHSIITVSVITALLPRISRMAANNEKAKVRNELERSLTNVAVATVPSAIAFLFFGTAIATLLFSGSTRADSAQIGLVLAAFSLGLVPYSAHLLLLRGFYAFEDTRTPVLINLASTALSIILCLISGEFLPLKWVTVGLAIALGLGNLLGTLITLKSLGKNVGAFNYIGLLKSHLRLTFVALLAGAPALGLYLLMEEIFGTELIVVGLTLTIASSVMGALYLLFGSLFKVNEINSLRIQIVRRLGRKYEISD